MTWEKTNSSTMSKKETAIAFAEFLWEYVVGDKRDWWLKYQSEYNTEFDGENEEKSTEQIYNIWNRLNNQETN